MPAPIQVWGPIPNNVTYNYNGGVLSPSPGLIEFTIKDIIGLPNSEQYSDFRLAGNVEYIPYNPKKWIAPDSYNNNGYPIANGNYIPYNNGMFFEFIPEFQNLSFLPAGTHYFNHTFIIEALNNEGVWFDYDIFTFSVILIVSNEVVNPNVSFTPENFDINKVQNVLTSVSVAMTGNLWKFVGKPNFVLSSLTSGITFETITDGSGTYQTASGSGNAIIIITLDSYYDSEVVWSAGDLIGTWNIFSDNVLFGTINYNIEITRLSDFFVNPYGAKAFTLDPKFFELKSTNLNTYFQFDATIKVYDFFTDVEKTYLIPLKIVLFNGKAKENLGQIIHRLMSKFSEVNSSLLQYKEAVLKIKCSEILFTDETIIRSGETADIPFIAGLSNGITTLGILDFNVLPNRVTKNSFAYLNILIPSGSYELRTFKNGTLISSVALPVSTGRILCKKVLFSTYEKGDVIQYTVDIVGATNVSAPSKKYIVFPDNYYSNMIVWENEYLLQSAIECTGTTSIVPEGEFISQKVYVDLVEKLEHLTSTKTVKLNINTGWLLYSDIDTIESLMRSKNVWLIQGNKTISLRPLSKKLPAKDVEQELISFQLEFQINQNYNEETYSL